MSSVDTVTMSVTETLSGIVNSIETALDGVQFHQDDFDGQFKDAFKHVQKNQTNILETEIGNIFESENCEKLEKNRDKSVELREKGNKYFQSDKYLEALECYNNSVILAPCPENLDKDCKYEDLAISLTNR